MYRPKIAREVHGLVHRKLRKRKLRGRKLRGHSVCDCTQTIYQTVGMFMMVIFPFLENYVLVGKFELGLIPDEKS